MSAVDAGRALHAAADWLLRQDAPESAIAAHELGRAESTEDAERWVRWTLDQERDGSWDEDLPTTVQALATLRELRQAASLKEQDPAIGRALDWVRSRRGRPGAWTDGCSADRHRRAFCHHFAAGFYSPAPPEVDLSDLALPSGARPAGDADARFIASAAALRCTLLWRGTGTDAPLHLEVLRRVVAGWDDAPPPGLSTTALLAAAHALIASPAETDRGAAQLALRIVAGRQRGDGSWVDADPFHAMAVFGAAVAAGIGGRRVTDTLDHCVRLLVAAQRNDGSWGPEHGPRRALIGLRTLR